MCGVLVCRRDFFDWLKPPFGNKRTPETNTVWCNPAAPCSDIGGATMRGCVLSMPVGMHRGLVKCQSAPPKSPSVQLTLVEASRMQRKTYTIDRTGRNRWLFSS